jgi:hypothetical protein
VQRVDLTAVGISTPLRHGGYLSTPGNLEQP